MLFNIPFKKYYTVKYQYFFFLYFIIRFIIILSNIQPLAFLSRFTDFLIEFIICDFQTLI